MAGMIKKNLKKLMAWLHLWLGLASGLVLLIVCLTGSLLTFEDELEPVIYRKVNIVAVPSTNVIPLDSLTHIAENAYPGIKLSRVVVSAERDRSVEFRLGRKGKGKGLKEIFVNPYTGEVTYKGNYGSRFFQLVIDIHRYLLLGKTGKVITGISCAICFFLLISGIVIWWPANKKAIKQRFKIKWDASGKRLTWDLHAVSGFYISIFLVFITLTGLIWSYDWVEDLLFQLADGKPRKEVKVKNLEKGDIQELGLYQGIYEQINRIYPWEGQVTLNMPEKDGQAITVQKVNEEALTPESDAAYFDSHSGRLIEKLPFNNLSTANKIRKMNLPIHAGSILGWPTQIIALIVVLFTGSLPITGFLIWWRRGKKSKKKPAKKLVKSPIMKAG